jgi:hypothetical protein
MYDGILLAKPVATVCISRLALVLHPKPQSLEEAGGLQVHSPIYFLQYSLSQDPVSVAQPKH